MKRKPDQFALKFDAPEDFALVPEETTDWTKIGQEREQAELDRKESQLRQTGLFGE